MSNYDSQSSRSLSFLSKYQTVPENGVMHSAAIFQGADRSFHRPPAFEGTFQTECSYVFDSMLDLGSPNKLTVDVTMAIVLVYELLWFSCLLLLNDSLSYLFKIRLIVHIFVSP